MEDMEEGGCASVSSESCESLEPSKKRQRIAITATNSLITLAHGIGFIGDYNENSDSEDSIKSSCSERGCKTPSTTVISDSEDEIYDSEMHNNLNEEAVLEFEPPGTSDEESKEDEDDNEPALELKSCDDSDDEKDDNMAKNLREGQPCVVCKVMPRDASLIHGHIGHQVCCLACGQKLKDLGKKCPVCRKPIHHVIKNFL